MLLTTLAGGSLPPFMASPPPPLYAGHGGSPADQSARHPVEAGPARTRRRYFAPYETINVEWSFSSDRYTAFRDWYYREDGANGGAAWFSLVAAINGDSEPAAISARFSAPYKWELVTCNRYSVTASLEVRDA